LVSAPCSSAQCGTDCATLLNCGWSSGLQECRSGAHTTAAEMAEGTCVTTTTPSATVSFINAFPDTDAQFSTMFSRAAIVFTVQGIVTLDECFNSCSASPACVGFGWWIGKGGVHKCRGLHNLGTSEGLPISKTGMISYRKVTSTAAITTSAVLPTAASSQTCLAATCGAHCSQLVGCGWSSGHAECRSGARTTNSELSLGVCT
jgi:hypothetical protein